MLLCEFIVLNDMENWSQIKTLVSFKQSPMVVMIYLKKRCNVFNILHKKIIMLFKKSANGKGH